MDKQRLTDLLLTVDEEYSLAEPADARRPRVIIIGGSAFMLRDLTLRPSTHDVDILSAESAVRAIMGNYPEINGAASAYMDQIPYNFEDRLVLLEIGSKRIDFMTPSTEDLIVMKLYAQRTHDIQDIEDAIAQGKVNWDLLEKLVYDPGEAKAAALVSRRYDEMVDAFARLRERHAR